MITKTKSTKTFQSGSIEGKFSIGKYGQYTYRSPMYGYKKAYKYGGMLTILKDGKTIFPWTGILKGIPQQYIKAIIEAIDYYYNHFDKPWTSPVKRFIMAKELKSIISWTDYYNWKYRN